MQDTVTFINELPHKLRIELAFRIHKKVLSGISFFQDRPKDFIAFVGNLLHPMHALPGQFIYQEEDPVLDIHFLGKGEAWFVLQKCDNLPFLTIEQGNTFGIVDLIPADRSVSIDKEIKR